MTINYARESVIDFTKPFMNLGISILFKVSVPFHFPQFNRHWLPATLADKAASNRHPSPVEWVPLGADYASDASLFLHESAGN